MPTSKKPRKKYRPPAQPVSIGHNKMFRFNAEGDMWMKIAPHQDLESLRRGEANANSFNNLATRIYWGARLERDCFESDEAQAIMQSGLRAIDAISGRYDRTGKFGATGEELGWLGDALNTTDDMQSKATRKELEASLRAVLKISKEKLKELQA